MLSPAQDKTLKAMVKGVPYTAQDLYCHTRTLWALVRNGYVECLNAGERGTIIDPAQYLMFKKVRNNG